MSETIEISRIKVKSKWVRMTGGVDDLAESIKTIGLINPIIINKKNELIAGGRRYRAVKQLGWREVSAIRIDKDSVDEELISIDENIKRTNIMGQDLEEILYRRKQIYEQKYPETRHGGDRKAHQVATLATRFTKDASDKLGRSERSIERDVSRAERSSEKVKAARRANKIGIVAVDEMLVLTKKEQDNLLPALIGKDGGEAREVVRYAKVHGVSSALKISEQAAELKALFTRIRQTAKKLNEDLEYIIKNKVNFRGLDASIVAVDLEGILEKLLKLFEVKK